ncbi:thiamine-phosphate kinase [Oxalobacter paraformigenes]|uniref:Thiamine-monophosphate kinase n=1 Tax=Oxalobacter paraformigenes TaxID=556268 RepID=C3X579_9BURK|nr:thiamine-phosphate kinase [Oxalobacter paraformigenes]EEO28365.1 thiamine-monophosphate kinase [Oxalobacter paraformigenes]
MLSEFDLIAKYFTKPVTNASLGIGDDCALLRPTPGTQMAISSDMLVSGTHFFPDTDPRQLGHKSLAVNLSDLAAMGAEPVAFTLALALPEPDEAWLKPFSEGLFSLANLCQCELIGGDTTRGPLNICITIFGQIPLGQALRRDKAQHGDDIWISGTIGDARLALAHCRHETVLSENEFNMVLQRLQTPIPRIALGIALRKIANAALDLSDGLLGDLSHILDASRVGATLNIDALPISSVLEKQPEAFRLQCALGGGDDYELCFTAPIAKRGRVLEASEKTGVPVTRIGFIEKEPGLRLCNTQGELQHFSHRSFDHFLTSKK